MPEIVFPRKPSIQELSPSMVENFLNEWELSFTKDDDGDYVAGFEHDYWGAILVYLMLRGERKEVYIIRSTCRKTIPKSGWGKTMMVCNTWNRTRFLPKACLHVDEDSADSEGSIMLQWGIDLEAGTYQEFLNYFSQQVFNQIQDFWIWAHEEQGL
jgi:hypothetical protein